MDLSTFKNSLAEGEAPPLPVYLLALWQDAKGNWEAAHDLVQDPGDQKAAWVHAYLHRKEGDIRNADYWYNKAGRARPQVSLNQEWEELVQAFL